MKLDAYRTKLPSGLRLIVIERPDAPVVAVRAVVRAGQLHERRPGVSWLAGRTLAAGAGGRDEDDLVDALEFAGTSLETSGVGFGLKLPVDELPFAIEVAADLLARPRFEPAAVERERRVARAELEAEADEPRTVALNAFRELVYGAHPLGRNPRGDPDALRREDLLAYHSAFFHPGNTILAVAGAVEAAEVEALLRDATGSWQPSPPPATLLPVLRLPEVSAEDLHERDVEQVHLFTGHLGVRVIDPDFVSLRVMDNVLGTSPGFTDRISRRVREELGLAYIVHADICSTAGTEPGVFCAYLATSPEHWRRALEEIVVAMREMRTHDVGEDELDAVKTYLADSYVFEFQTAEDVAGAAASMEYFGLGLDYPERYLAGVAAVTADDVRAASRRHLHPNRLLTVALGRVTSAT